MIEADTFAVSEAKQLLQTENLDLELHKVFPYVTYVI